jgi:hypothetical protein
MVRVTEPFSNGFHGDTIGDEKTRVGMSEVVISDRGKARPFDESSEELADRFGVERLTQGVREHLIARPDRMAIAHLSVQPCVQNRFGAWVEFDGSSACTGLGRELR